MSLRYYHFESAWGRGGYVVNDINVVVKAAPIISRFVGKKVDRLEAWLKLYKCKIDELPNDKEVTLIR